ncbi:MAG: hypothetical protein U5M53_12220, partial [Rhodoferax sp.]|nr:hypothetical protein [Rhodoferax sp.]
MLPNIHAHLVVWQCDDHPTGTVCGRVVVTLPNNPVGVDNSAAKQIGLYNEMLFRAPSVQLS